MENYNGFKFYDGKTISEMNLTERKLFENDLVLLLGLMSYKQLKDDGLDDSDALVSLNRGMMQMQLTKRTMLIAELVPHIKALPEGLREFMAEKSQYSYKKFLDDTKTLIESAENGRSEDHPLFKYAMEKNLN
jgi:hypothetical protein